MRVGAQRLAPVPPRLLAGCLIPGPRPLTRPTPISQKAASLCQRAHPAPTICRPRHRSSGDAAVTRYHSGRRRGLQIRGLLPAGARLHLQCRRLPLAFQTIRRGNEGEAAVFSSASLSFGCQLGGRGMRHANGYDNRALSVGHYISSSVVRSRASTVAEAMTGEIARTSAEASGRGVIAFRRRRGRSGALSAGLG